MNLFQQFEEILSKLKAAGITGALIAGGACRDHILGRPVKDIDVFVPDQEGIEMKLGAAFGHLHVNPIIAAEYAGAGGEVDHVYEVSFGDDPFGETHIPVQAIVLAQGLDPIERARHHDFGICQAWYVEGTQTAIGFIQATEAFHLDMGNKTFTLSHCEDVTQFDRSMRRWGRFKERFPEFTVVVSDEYRSLYDVFYA
jgi:hypothetical protein